MKPFATTADAHAAAQDRIAQRFEERPELWESYQALPDEERAQAKADIMANATADMQIDTGRTRPVKTATGFQRLAAGLAGFNPQETREEPITRPLYAPEVEKSWAAVQSGELAYADLPEAHQKDVLTIGEAYGIDATVPVEPEPDADTLAIREGLARLAPPEAQGTAANVKNALDRGFFGQAIGMPAQAFAKAREIWKDPYKGVTDAPYSNQPNVVLVDQGEAGVKLVAPNRMTVGQTREFERIKAELADQGQAVHVEEREPEEVSVFSSEQIGEWRKEVEARNPVDQAFRESLPGQVTEGLGQAAGMIPMAALGLPAALATSFGMAYQAGEDSYREASERQGFAYNEAEAREAGIKGLPAGFVDALADRYVLGKILRPLKGQDLPKSQLVRTVMDGLKSAAAGGTTEGLQTVYENINAKYLSRFDDDAKISDGVIDSIIVGAFVDGAVSTAGATASTGVNKLLGRQPITEVAPGTEQATSGSAQTVAALDNFNAGLNEAGQADPNFDAFAALRAASSTVEKGASPTVAQPGDKPSRPSPTIPSKQSPVSPVVSGTDTLAALQAEAQALSKNKLGKEITAINKRMKVIARKLEIAKPGTDTNALAREANALYERKDVFEAARAAKKPGTQIPRLAPKSPSGADDYISEALERDPVPYDPKDNANLLNNIDPRLLPFFKKGKASDTMTEDNNDPVATKRMESEGEYGQVEVHLQMLEDALRARDAEQAEQNHMEYMGKTADAFEENKHRSFAQNTKNTVRMSDLQVGDSFNIRGEHFEVKGFTDDGKMIVEDGRQFIVPADLEVFLDRGQVRAAPIQPGQKPGQYIREAVAENKAFEAGLLKKARMPLPRGYRIKGDHAEPRTNKAQATKQQADLSKRLLRQGEKEVLAEEVAEGRVPTSELPESYFEELYQAQLGKTVSNDTNPLDTDDFNLVNDDLKDPDAQRQQALDQRAAESNQAQMFGTDEVRGIEGEDTEFFDSDPNLSPQSSSASVQAAVDAARAERPGTPQSTTRYALHLNEITELAAELGQGRYPKVAEAIKRNPNARGVFRSKSGDPQGGSIEIKADTAELLTEAEFAEIQDAALDAAYQAWLDKLEASGQAGAKGPPSMEQFVKQLEKDPMLQMEYAQLEASMLDEKRREVAPVREPYQAVTTLAHEIGHWIDFLPDGTMQRGNVLGRIKSVSNYFKRMVEKVPGDAATSDLLSSKERAKLRREAVKAAGGDKIEAARIYQEMVETERQARGLIRLEDVKAELEALTVWWRLKGDASQLTDYHKKPAELYADAFSVLVNAPAELAARAPIFYSAFEAHFGSKDAAREAYEFMQSGIKHGTSQTTQEASLTASLSDERAILTPRAGKIRGSEIWDGLTSMLGREFQPFYKRAKRAGLREFERSRDVIGRFLYRATAHELYLSRLNNHIMGPLAQAGVDMVTFDKYLFHKHVTENRFNKLNPKGWTAKTSTKALQKMEARDPVAYAAMEAAQAEWFKIRQKMVIAPLRESGVFNDALMETIEERVYYVPFRKKPEDREMTDGIEDLLHEQFGADKGMRIAREVGQLGEIKSPSNSLMGIDLRLMDFVKRNRAKQEVVRVMQKTDPKHVAEAETRRVQVGQRWVEEPKHVENARMGTLYTMNDGKIHAHYLPKAVIAPFNKEMNVNAEWYSKALYHANHTFKAIFTQLNPGFWPVALVRDVLTLYRKLPAGEADPWHNFAPIGIPKIAAKILKSFPASWATVKGEQDAGGELAMERDMLISRRETMGHGNTFKGSDISRAIIEFSKDPRNYWNKRVSVEKQVAKALNFYMSIGQAFERAPKIATMKYLDEHHAAWPEWKKRNFVVAHGGSPDFMQRGTAAHIADLFFLFLNPAREGWMSEGPAAMADKKGYALRTAQTILPSLAMKLAGLGMLGAAGTAMLAKMMPWIEDEEELEEMYKSISHYDMINYDCIPLFWVDKEQKKVAYLRLPKDETSRLVSGAIMQPALDGDATLALSYMGGALPGKNPLIGVLDDWITYGVHQQNPYDTFLQRDVIDDATFKAGKGTEQMLWNSWNKLGGSIIKRVDNEAPSFTKKTKLEEFLELPGVQNVGGRWFKVSNAGQRQRLSKHTEVIEAGKTAALETLAARELTEKIVNQQDLTKEESDALLYSANISEKVYRNLDAVTKRSMGPQWDAYHRAQTSAEKEAILKLIAEER